MSTSSAQHCFLGVSKCPVSVPVHAFGLGMIACSLYHSYRLYQAVPTKESGVKMPIAFTLGGRPAMYTHACVGAAFYPTLILLQSGAECGYGMFREATRGANGKCPLTGCARLWVEFLLGTSIITLFAQTVATHIVVDKKTPEQVEAEIAKGNSRYYLSAWKIVAPIALAFLPATAAAVCKAIHKK